MLKKRKEENMIAPKGSLIVTFDWLESDVLIIFTDKQRKKVAKQLGVTGDEGFMVPLESIGGLSYSVEVKGQLYYVMFLPFPEDVDTTVHECTHMVHLICDAHGIPLSMDNTETLAYMTGYLFAKIVNGIKEGGVNEAKTAKAL